MGLFSNKNNSLLLEKDAQEVVAAIREAEMMTSGEVRVFIESHCAYVNAMDRAWEIFAQLKMEATAERNAVLVYLALLDKQIAIIGDEGIHQRVKDEHFWAKELERLKEYCRAGRIKEGLCTVVLDIGQALARFFPPKPDEEHNEIPDEIVFGR